MSRQQYTMRSFPLWSNYNMLFFPAEADVQCAIVQGVVTIYALCPYQGGTNAQRHFAREYGDMPFSLSKPKLLAVFPTPDGPLYVCEETGGME